MGARSSSTAALLEPLERAAHALSQGDGVAALDALLAAWRLRRTPSLAALVERLSARLPVPPVSDATDGKKRMLAFAERAHPRRAADVGPLLDDFRTVLPKVQAHLSTSRAKILKQLDPDPRIAAFARWALEHFESFLYSPPALHKLFTSLEKAHADSPKAPPPDAALAARLEALAGQIDAATLKPVELAVAAPDANSVVGLLASVYADPTNDDLRQVVGDRLVELGDPRGELIALQYRKRAGALDDVGEKRIESLLRKHLSAWLGPLGPLVVKSSVVFERGFPARLVSTARRVFERKQAVLLPEWNTVEDLQFNAVSWVTPAMRCLRVVRELGADGLADLLALASPPPLEALSLVLRTEEATGEEWPTIVGRLPHLRRFDFELSNVGPNGDTLSVSLKRVAAHLLPACVDVGVVCAWHRSDDAAITWLPGVIDTLPATVERVALHAKPGDVRRPAATLSRDGELVLDGAGLYAGGFQHSLRGGQAGLLGPLFRLMGERIRRARLHLDGPTAKYVAGAEDALRTLARCPVEVIRPG